MTVRGFINALAPGIFIGAALAVLLILIRPHSAPPTVSPRAVECSQLASTFDIVLLGDSLTDRGRRSELMPGPQIANRGIDRDTVSMAATRLDVSLSRTEGPVFIMLGINDLVAGYPIDKIVADCRRTPILGS